jgi:hypothetical protein
MAPDTGHALPSGVPELAIPFQSKRRDVALLFQKVQHVIPAFPLLGHGLERLRHEAHGASLLLGAGEVVSSALVLGAFARHLRSMRAGATHGKRAAHHGVDWVDLCLGAMLAIEVWAHWHETGHVKRPLVLLSVAMLVLGLLHGRIAAFASRRQALTVDDTGVTISLRPFSRFTAAWDQLAVVDLDDHEARVVRKDGRATKIDFRDLRNAADVRAALERVRLRLPRRRRQKARNLTSTARGKSAPTRR